MFEAPDQNFAVSPERDAEPASAADILGALSSFVARSSGPEAEQADMIGAIAAGTRITTPDGPRRVEALRPGDRVLTRDSGAQPIRFSAQMSCPAHGGAAAVRFAPGALGNPRALFLAQQHRVLVRSPLAGVLFGQSEVFVPAMAFVGRPDVTLEVCGSLTWCHPVLPRHEVILAEGVPCESRLAGPAGMRRLGVAAEWARGRPDPDRPMPALSAELARPALRLDEARVLLCALGRGARWVQPLPRWRQTG